MDLFDVDPWSSNKEIDKLNSSLFGAVSQTVKTSKSRGKPLTQERRASKKKQKKLKNIENKPGTKGKENVKIKINNKQGKDTNTSLKQGGKQPTKNEVKVKKQKKKKSTSSKVEVIETNHEDGQSASFTDFLNTDQGKGIGILKKKRKSSSKRNKYKHLDDFRKAQQQDVNGTKTNKSKVDIDISAKLNSPVTTFSRNLEKSQVNEERTNEVNRDEKNKVSKDPKTSDVHVPNKDSDSPKRRKKKKKLIRNEMKDIPEINDKGGSLGSSETQKKVKGKKRKQDTSNVSDLALAPKQKKIKSSINGEEKVTLVQAKPKNIVKISTLDKKQLKEALKKESESVKKEPNPKPKELPKTKKPLSLRDRMLEQLNSARFRYINEQLYTVPGHEVRSILTYPRMFSHQPFALLIDKSDSCKRFLQ